MNIIIFLGFANQAKKAIAPQMNTWEHDVNELSHAMTKTEAVKMNL